MEIITIIGDYITDNKTLIKISERIGDAINRQTDEEPEDA